MGGAADLPQRSSSPLKRSAESMESDEPTTNGAEDVPMGDSPRNATNDRPTSHTRAVSVDMLAEENSTVEVPPIDEQIETITKLVTEEASRIHNEGDKVYLVSRKWLGRVQARGSNTKASAEDLEGEIGPVDNSDITREVLTDAFKNKFVRLHEGMGEGEFAVLPEEAWSLVEAWYGLPPDTPPIIRFAQNTNEDKNGIPNVLIEYHPLVLKLHRLWSEISPIPIPAHFKADNPPAPILVVPKSANYKKTMQLFKRVLEIELLNKVRVWSITALPKSDDAPPTPVSQGDAPSEPLADPFANLLVDNPAFTSLDDSQRQKMGFEARDTTIDPESTSSTTAGMAFAGADTVVVLDEEIPDTNDFVSNFTKDAASKTPITLKLRGTETKQPSDESGRSSPRSGPVTRGRSRKTGKTLGCVGLTNLGNTCYMNSALQCVRSVEELTKYFLTGEWENELNTDNPLGNNGEVASSYARLLEDCYRDGTSVVRPSQFKSTIGRYAPSFSGYGQQDSQEFLGFLLDGLQEDLSRVKKKPYIEKPDSTDEMVNDPKAIREMAAKVWDISKKRDDSVIADLFTGMYKSTLVCPECAKVSITFDPFNNLTLQLPIENSINHVVRYFPLNDHPVRIDIEMDKNGTIKTMKNFVSKRVNVPVDRLFMAEEWKNKLYKVFDDFTVLSEDPIAHSDIINIYELEDVPTNWPVPKRKKQRSMLNISDDDEDVPAWDSPAAQKMLVPVHHRSHSTQSYKQDWKASLVPHFIILTPEEAKSEEAIKRKILEKVATLTTHADFHKDDVSEDGADQDGVIMSGSDASDGKVVAKSVDGEDDVVDVTMNDPDTVRESTEKPDESEVASVPASPTMFQGRRPKFVDPKEYLDPIMHNMFTISYTPSTKRVLPVGFDTIKESDYPLLSTRAPQSATGDRDSSFGSPSSDGHDISQDGDAEEGGSSESAPTRMNEESDDEDLLQKDDHPVKPAGAKIVMKGGRRVVTKRALRQNKKAAKTVKSSSQGSNQADTDSFDGGPLVRPGEGLIVDWSPEAYNTLFDGTVGDTLRGVLTTINPSLLPDPELAAKRDRSNLRRRQGITLDDCLDEFGKEEILSEMDTWYCPRCKEHRRASKKFELWKTPDILVMHLKRFSSSTIRRDKLDVLVDFPIEGLDLTSRVIENQEGKQEIYDLFAVDDHWGGLGGGHYTAHAKSFFDGCWYEYNDSSVSKKNDPSRVVTPGAYLLFYRRRSEKPLGGPRLQEIVERYDNPDADWDSGEVQRLDADSSRNGSSSAFQTGVEAPHPPAGLSGPLTRTRTHSSTITEDEIHDLSDHDHDHDDANTLGSFGQQWSFKNLNQSNMEGLVAPSEASSVGGVGSIDGRSDLVDDNSSAGPEERARRYAEFGTTDPLDWEEPSAVPDMTEDEQVATIGLEDLRGLAARSEDPPVGEIHVEEGEGLNGEHR